VVVVLVVVVVVFVVVVVVVVVGGGGVDDVVVVVVNVVVVVVVIVDVLVVVFVVLVYCCVTPRSAANAAKRCVVRAGQGVRYPLFGSGICGMSIFDFGVVHYGIVFARLSKIERRELHEIARCLVARQSNVHLHSNVCRFTTDKR